MCSTDKGQEVILLFFCLSLCSPVLREWEGGKGKIQWEMKNREMQKQKEERETESWTGCLSPFATSRRVGQTLVSRNCLVFLDGRGNEQGWLGQTDARPWCGSFLTVSEYFCLPAFPYSLPSPACCSRAVASSAPSTGNTLTQLDARHELNSKVILSGIQKGTYTLLQISKVLQVYFLGTGWSTPQPWSSI